MRKRVRLLASAAAALLGATSAASAAPAGDNAGSVEFFEKRIRPLLVDNCYNCHSADTNARGGLRVDDRNGLLSGGGTGPAIVPGKAADSLLLARVGHADPAKRMPPKGQLSDEQLADLRKWIEAGAAWPEARIPKSLQSDVPNAEYDKLKREHWAWRPVATPAVPAVADKAWPRDDVDRFVLAKLEAAKLKPAADADKASLIRRATFDLTGLPPTPAEIEAFLNDASPTAFEKVVDRLLASPAFGERWGRHWLDVARYGESTGSSRNIPYPHAWRYRDYVIDSFNKDKPYDRFVQEQIAGDLLPAADQKARDEQLTATGFLALGVKDVNQRFKVRFVMDNVDEQIDTVSRSVLALTASCARCHDHKFDPITAREYYALAGIFTSTDTCDGVRNKMGGGGLDYYDNQKLLSLGEGAKNAPPPEKVKELKAKLAEARAAWDKIRGTPEGLAKGPDGLPTQRPYRLRFEKAQQELNALSDPAALGPVALGARDADKVADTEVRIRGEAEKLGPTVPRGFLSLARFEGQPTVNPNQSGRLELAQWLTSPKNPLASRVAANRVWHHLFGRGIVSTVDNFGVTGDTPSHPELLDHVASRFVQNGWSVKSLVRSLVLTRTYQLGSDAVAENVAVDPAGKLLWRHNPRRLGAEEIRDATLAAAGQLDAYRPAGSPTQALPFVEQRNNGPEAARFAGLARASLHRSVYLPLVRGWVPTSLEVFDFGDQSMVAGSRDATTVAPQALYLLNDPFVRKQSLALAERVLNTKDLDDAGRLELAYRLTLGRPATAAEAQRATAFLSAYEATAAEVLAAEAAERPAEVAVAEPAPEAKPAAAKQPAAGGKKGKRAAEIAKATEQARAAAAATNAQATPATKPTETAVADATTGGQAANGGQVNGGLPVIDPDQVVTGDTVVKEEVIRASDAKTAAWAAFAQALIGSAEFRYVK